MWYGMVWYGSFTQNDYIILEICSWIVVHGSVEGQTKALEAPNSAPPGCVVQYLTTVKSELNEAGPDKIQLKLSWIWVQPRDVSNREPG